MSLVFVLFGLAVVAASINLLVLRFMTMWVQLELPTHSTYKGWTITNFIPYSRQIEDNRREEMEEEMQKGIMVDEEVELTLNGKLLAERLISAGNEDTDQVSVCSCSCLDLRNHKNNYHDALLPMNLMYTNPSPYMPPVKRPNNMKNLQL